MTVEDYRFLVSEMGDFYWYWQNKAKHVKKFTAMDIIRYFSFNMDQSDKDFLMEFFSRDSDLKTLYGEESYPPGTYRWTTWELLAYTMASMAEIASEIYLAMHGFGLMFGIKAHKRAMTLYNAWMAHYMRMMNLADKNYLPDVFHPYPPDMDEDPWWMV